MSVCFAYFVLQTLRVLENFLCVHHVFLFKNRRYIEDPANSSQVKHDSSRRPLGMTHDIVPLYKKKSVSQVTDLTDIKIGDHMKNS